MLDKLKSRKLWATVLGAALVSLGTELGLTDDQTQLLVGLVMAYVVGQGIADRTVGP